jgi:chemotaxis family two-component system response regulator Rcp1
MKPIEVLLVDDSPGDVFLTRQALADEPHPIHVRVAVDGAEALRLLTEQNVRPDLMILDLDMPRVPGLAVLERYHATFPVVVFSASASLDDQTRALELGAMAFVRKSNHFDAFADQVSQIVRNWVRG